MYWHTHELAKSIMSDRIAQAEHERQVREAERCRKQRVRAERARRRAERSARRNGAAPDVIVIDSDAVPAKQPIQAEERELARD